VRAWHDAVAVTGPPPRSSCQDRFSIRSRDDPGISTVGMKTCSRRKGEAPPAKSRHKLIAYQIYEEDSAPIRAAPRERKWMEDADKKFPYRCLPLVIANQYGWEILSTHHVRASWDGTSAPDALHVETGGLVRRKPIREWPPALPLSLRRRSADFSTSIPVQDTRWLESDGPWSHKQPQRRHRSSRWRY